MLLVLLFDAGEEEEEKRVESVFLDSWTGDRRIPMEEKGRF